MYANPKIRIMVCVFVSARFFFIHVHVYIYTYMYVQCSCSLTCLLHIPKVEIDSFNDGYYMYMYFCTRWPT